MKSDSMGYQWAESVPTLYCVDPLPELDDEPCYNEHYQDGPLACQVQCHVPKGALDLNDLLLTPSRRYESEGTLCSGVEPES